MAVIAPLAVLPAVASAQTPDPAKAADAVVACLKVPDGPERLGCYNRLAEGLKARMGDYEKVRAKEAEAKFGAEVLKGKDAPPSETPDRIAATVKAVSRDKDGRTVFILDNGQEWLFLDNRRVFVRAGDKVVVKTAMLGSYTMVADGSNDALKVRRLR